MFAHLFSTPGKRRLVVGGFAAAGLTTLVAVVAVALLSLNARPAFGSGTGGGGCFTTTSNPVCTFSGHQAYADFSSVSPDGCTFTDAWVNPLANITLPGRSATQVVFISLSVFNNCTGDIVEAVTNIDPVTYVPDFTGSMQFSQDLSSASLTGTAPMFDNSTGAQVFTSTLNITWTGYGSTTTFLDSSQDRGAGFLYEGHFMGTSRNAEATGVFTDVSGDNVAATPTLTSILSDETSGAVEISRS